MNKILHDPAFCIGCRACQTACQDANGLPAERTVLEILERDSGSGTAQRVQYYMKGTEKGGITFRLCGGCAAIPEGPVCVRTCPFRCLAEEH